MGTGPCRHRYASHARPYQGRGVHHRHPVSAFDWTNHVLACSLCNSHLKKAVFPLDPDGKPLLIDPTAEDPTPHLRLVLAVGQYHPLTPGGRAPSTCST
ncbi:hypothetical protein [Kitasatospora purpeofusca]|uniref:hypothetical protein n=1 Tax=Kitasatospora purpeofusca TaxID=67352 RepID=UPI002A5A2306|nr:hypothetical protein [Kitasatospora purpeofusca]MDY0810698.1 hypothetical protein [Kitasatospora purpeofusca]